VLGNLSNEGTNLICQTSTHFTKTEKFQRGQESRRVVLRLIIPKEESEYCYLQEMEKKSVWEGLYRQNSRVGEPPGWEVQKCR